MAALEGPARAEESPLPELVRRAAERVLLAYCRQWEPPSESPARLGFSVRGNNITLFQEMLDRVTSTGIMVRPVARFRFSAELNQWTLHYHDPERGWRFYLNVGPSLDLGKLLKHLDQDPTRTFWD